MLKDRIDWMYMIKLYNLDGEFMKSNPLECTDSFKWDEPSCFYMG